MYMCNVHKLCINANLSIIKEKNISRKILLWLYTKHNSKLRVCLIKEKFRNYYPISGHIKNEDEGCYIKTLIRILNENHITIILSECIKIFSNNPIVKFYQEMPIFIGYYENIPRHSIKNKIKNECGAIENFEFFNLLGESSSKYKRNVISFLTNDIINKSIDEGWVNFING